MLYMRRSRITHHIYATAKSVQIATCAAIIRLASCNPSFINIAYINAHVLLLRLLFATAATECLFAILNDVLQHSEIT